MNAVAKAVATALGAGYSPIAPGTCGTVVAIPLVWAAAPLSLLQYVGVVMVLTAVAIWASDRADRAWGTKDNQRIVIDEVAGYAVTMVPVARDAWPELLVGFVVFRALDILKPPPVRWLERNLPGGFGVVLDDVGAGVIGAIGMVVLDRFGVFAKLASL
ncbi:MAG: phosphatidylglycerophosphatase A [Kofleriaceae bacterium]